MFDTLLFSLIYRPLTAVGIMSLRNDDDDDIFRAYQWWRQVQCVMSRRRVYNWHPSKSISVRRHRGKLSATSPYRPTSNSRRSSSWSARSASLPAKTTTTARWSVSTSRRRHGYTCSGVPARGPPSRSNRRYRRRRLGPSRSR